MDVHYSSRSDNWSTPWSLFYSIAKVYHPTTDVCATADNAKCEKYYTPEMDGLTQTWEGVCFMNPPYGRQIKWWVKKAYESAQAGATVVCILPARTDTAWWHDYVMGADITFLRGRVKFGGARHSAPFPTAIVVFYPPKYNETKEV